MTTAISIALSVEDDEFTADPPMNVAVDWRASFFRTASQSLQRNSALSSRFLSGRFAASRTLSRERRKRLDLIPRFSGCRLHY